MNTPEKFESQFEDFEMNDHAQSIIDKFIKFQQGVQPYIIYPSQLETNVIHKCFISTAKHSFRSDGYGNEDKYILFPATATKTGVFTKRNDMVDGKAFVLMLPTLSFRDMFNYAGKQFEMMLQNHLKELGEAPSYEIHFYKKTKRRYYLTYCALVTGGTRGYDENGRVVHDFTFVRKLIDDSFRHKGVKDKK